MRLFSHSEFPSDLLRIMLGQDEVKHALYMLCKGDALIFWLRFQHHLSTVINTISNKVCMLEDK